MREYKIYALSESDFINEDNCFRVLHDISLMDLDEDVKNFGQKINSLTNDFLQLLCEKYVKKKQNKKGNDRQLCNKWKTIY